VTSEMVDKVALALLNEMALQTGYEPWTWDGLSEQQRDYYRRCARAAIGAMRWPSDAMIDAGFKACAGRSVATPGLAKEVGTDSYRAMIDAARD